MFQCVLSVFDSLHTLIYMYSSIFDVCLFCGQVNIIPANHQHVVTECVSMLPLACSSQYGHTELLAWLQTAHASTLLSLFLLQFPSQSGEDVMMVSERWSAVITDGLRVFVHFTQHVRSRG